MKKIAIVGSGVVGQATGKSFLSKGFEVAFFDINRETLAQSRSKGYQALHMEDMDLTEREVIFVSVPTPTLNGRFVPTHLLLAIEAIGVALKKATVNRPQKYRVVAIKSTLLPGTTEKEVIPLLERTSGKKVRQDFGICVTPAYLRDKHAEEDALNPRIIVIGESDPKAGDIIEELYKPFNCPIYRLPIIMAEFQKYVHNLFNANKISFFNEMRLVAKALGIDSASKIFELVAQSAEGMWNPIDGTRDWGPFGGSCLPKDSEAFLTFAKEELNVDMPMLEATIRINNWLRERQS